MKGPKLCETGVKVYGFVIHNVQKITICNCFLNLDESKTNIWAAQLHLAWILLLATFYDGIPSMRLHSVSLKSAFIVT